MVKFCNSDHNSCKFAYKGGCILSHIVSSYGYEYGCIFRSGYKMNGDFWDIICDFKKNKVTERP